jgi:two-component system response regulator
VPKTDIKKSFGTSVKGWRQQLGFSQEELAERADLHRTYISDVERGARNLSLESINKLARALDISVSALFPTEEKGDGISGADAATDAGRNVVDILLVEDNANDIELTLQAFQKARFANRVQIARDGEEALDYLFYRGKFATRQESQHPQVILLDLKLPKVSGLEVLRAIKADKRTAAMAVVVLTVSDDSHDIAECLRLGAANYIVKPVNFVRLSQTTPSLNLEWILLKPTEPKAN